MIKEFRRLNEALPGLLLGILIYGGLVEVIGIWFVSDKIRYTTGLLIGIACAIGMAIHLAVILDETVRTQNAAPRMIKAKSVLRYIAVVVVFFVMMWLNLGNLYSAFIGVLGLKVSAYAQPLLHKIFHLHKKEESSMKDEEVKL
ncbi:MAG: hypothetical protein K6E64_08385 [Lachnospiraceae bacterium]|nr:hypothetical protein [Lachnospiraceae bacterium]